MDLVLVVLGVLIGIITGSQIVGTLFGTRRVNYEVIDEFGYSPFTVGDMYGPIVFYTVVEIVVFFINTKVFLGSIVGIFIMFFFIDKLKKESAKRAVENIRQGKIRNINGAKKK